MKIELRRRRIRPGVWRLRACTVSPHAARRLRHCGPAKRPAMPAPAIVVSALIICGFVLAPPMAREASAQNKTGQTEAKPFTSKKDTRRLQRLLKLLANQNPARYGAVDPGVVDGNPGPGTIKAIRKFQRIIGVPENTAITRRLFAQILTAQAEGPAPAPSAKPAARPDCRVNNTCLSGAAPTVKKRSGSARAPGNEPKRRGSRFAQIASLKDEGRIPEEWTRLKQASPDLLQGRELIVEAANLGDRGIYHRILVGPFEGYQNADTFCVALRKKGQSCLVRKRSILALQTAKKLDTAAAKVGPAPVSRSTTAPPHAPMTTAIPAKPATSEKPIQHAATPPAPRRAQRPVVTVQPLPVPAGPDQSPDALSPDEVNQAQPIETVATSDSGATATVTDKAVAADKAAPPAVKPATAFVQWLTRADRIMSRSLLGPGIAAAAGTCFGLLFFVWRQRRRKNMMFESIPIDPWFDGKEAVGDEDEGIPDATKILEELRTQFENPDLAECRKVRDTFLQSLNESSGPSSSETGASEQAMLVNRKLNQMIATDPANYKSIFYNWIFLNHVAAMIEASGYSLRRLDPRIQQEFRLLASLFKIHLLELEARHHVRERIPNIFATLRQL